MASQLAKCNNLATILWKGHLLLIILYQGASLGQFIAEAYQNAKFYVSAGTNNFKLNYTQKPAK